MQCSLLGCVSQKSSSTIYNVHIHIYFEEDFLPSFYLELPLAEARRSGENWQGIKDKLKLRLDSWTNKYKSLAGRILLIHTAAKYSYLQGLYHHHPAISNSEDRKDIQTLPMVGNLYWKKVTPFELKISHNSRMGSREAGPRKPDLINNAMCKSLLEISLWRRKPVD